MSKKQPPNPYGKKGGPKHQAKVRQVESEYLMQEGTVRNEYYVRTPNGKKSSRFVDIAVSWEGKLGLFVQVCRMNKDGKTPVKRERDAAADINSVYPNIPIQFRDYEKED